jgi:dTDP-4-amino-4,6-dideoxygalactose transaminase
VADPIIEDEEINAVVETMRSGIIAQGPRVQALEEAFAAYCGTKYAVAVNSGTAAIHAALYAAGVGPGDEVITVPFSFIATINPILMVGAKPVLVDIEPTHFCMDMSKVEAAITDKTKAIIPVHLYGQPCNADDLKALAEKHNLIIIEDACQAIGADYKGAKTGSLGDMGCFSLYATKNIMCGEGGIVITDNEAFVTTMKQFRQHGMSAQYEYVDVGYNYRMMDLQAAIAIEQLKKVDTFNTARQKNAAQLSAGLADVKGLVLPTVAPGGTHVWHQYTIRLTEEFPMNRDELHETLKAKDIITGAYYPKPLHSFAHIQKQGYKIGDFPVAEKAASQVLSLPVHAKLSSEDVQRIIDEVKQVANGK